MSIRWQSPRETGQRKRQGAPARQEPSRGSDSEVLHVFTVNTGLIAAMDLGGEADPTAGPSAAFAHRSQLAIRHYRDHWNPRIVLDAIGQQSSAGNIAT